MDLKDNNIKQKKIRNSYANVLSSKSPLPPTPSPHPPQGIADSGATDHYLTVQDQPHCSKPTPSSTNITVLAADGNKMTSSHTAQIPLAPQLSPNASTGHILKGLTTGSLISIGKLCDDECIAIFTKYNVRIVKDGRIIIQGLRNTSNGLWNIPLAPKSHPLPPQTSTAPASVRGANIRTAPSPLSKPLLPPKTKPSSRSQSIASAIRTSATKANLASFLHAAAFSPVVSTLVRAISRGHFQSWPGLTTTLILQHLPKSIATAKGHLRELQQNIQSTKTILPPLPMASSLDVDPSQEPTNPRSKDSFITLIDNNIFE